jgi:BNR repeat-like domain
MRTCPRPSSRTAIVALALAAVVLSACTSSGATRSPRARADEPVDEGLTEEIAEQQGLVDERTEALEAATEAGTVGVIEDIRRDPSPGWAGERIVNRTGNDWEPSIAADPNAPYVYILHNRYDGEDACANGCPDPAMILHVSDDGGATWQPEHFLCRCKGIRGQFDPLIEVVPDTGDVVAVWMNGFRIQFARSTDHGATWTRPTWIHPDVEWGDKPNLAVSPDGQDVYVQFNGPTGGDAYAAVSHDGGVTWSTNKITDSGRYYFDYGGAVLPNGVVVFAQISFSYTGPDHAAEGVQRIHVFRSTDDGDTWSEIVVDELELGRECTSRSCYGDFYDSGPALAADDDGDLVIVYNGASEHFGPQTVYARSSKNGGITWSDRVPLSKDGANAAFPAAAGRGNDEVRVWFMAQRNHRWQVWYRNSDDLGATWSTREKLSDATSGTDYKHPNGFDEAYGDYGEIAITSDGHTIGVWGEGNSYSGPGGVWFNRQT